MSETKITTFEEKILNSNKNLLNFLKDVNKKIEEAINKASENEKE